mgnify:CR=1 FL=1
MEIKIFHVLRKGEKLFIDSAEIAEGDTVLHVQTVNPSISNENEQEFKKGLISCLNKIFPSTEIKKREADNPEHQKISDLLNKNIEKEDEFEFSVRLFNCLKAADKKTLKEIIKYDQSERKKNRSDYGTGYGLLQFRNFGGRNLQELEKFLKEKGLSLDMDLTPYE